MGLTKILLISTLLLHSFFLYSSFTHSTNHKEDLSAFFSENFKEYTIDLERGEVRAEMKRALNLMKDLNERTNFNVYTTGSDLFLVFTQEDLVQTIVKLDKNNTDGTKIYAISENGISIQRKYSI